MLRPVRAMVKQRSLLAVTATALLSPVLVGCTGSARTASEAGSATGTVAGSTAVSTSLPPTSSVPMSSAPATVASATTTMPATTPSTTAVLTPGKSSSSPTPSTISIPPNLCSATDIAQNTADAYMGALSAGNEKQALACVLPGTVPLAVTRSLSATMTGTAVYLPVSGADGPTVFGYTGSGRRIDVTVSRESDGTFWVTKVVTRAG